MFETVGQAIGALCLTGAAGMLLGWLLTRRKWLRIHEAEVETWRCDVDVKEREVERIAHRLTAQEDQLEGLEQEAKHAYKRVAELEREAAARVAEIEAARSRMASLDEKLLATATVAENGARDERSGTPLEESLAESDARIALYEALLTDLEPLAEAVAQRDAEIAELGAHHARVASEAGKRIESYEGVVAVLEPLTHMVAERDREIARVAAALTEANRRIAEYEERLDVPRTTWPAHTTDLHEGKRRRRERKERERGADAPMTLRDAAPKDARGG